MLGVYDIEATFSFTDNLLTEEEIVKLVKEIDVNKSSCVEGLSSKMCKVSMLADGCIEWQVNYGYQKCHKFLIQIPKKHQNTIFIQISHIAKSHASQTTCILMAYLKIRKFAVMALVISELTPGGSTTPGLNPESTNQFHYGFGYV